MKLDVNALRYLAKDDFRVLTAVEMGMRNVRSPMPCISTSHFVTHQTAGFRHLIYFFFCFGLVAA
jgi:RIO-like serine/threonine protein kinase